MASRPNFMFDINSRRELHKPVVPHKATMVLDSFARHKVRSFADLGACWGVNAGYSYQALMSFAIERAYIVDTHITELAKHRLKLYPAAETVVGEIGYTETVDRIPPVDAVIMFDMLVHQANPDWDEIIRMYAPKGRLFLIYNQQWVGSEHTVRLVDLGKEAYARNTPGGTNDAGVSIDARVEELFANLDKPHPLFDKSYRDAHNYWQWGITDADLIATMWKHGFRLEAMNDYGHFYGPLPNFRNHGFVFVREKPWEY